ncbi:MAG TPA: hypothetical protein VHU16_00150, partial [Candidatus Udaeobacter sp.]|nr:hypothetical protein [Candidatus Udaeobacter sp.]
APKNVLGFVPLLRQPDSIPCHQHRRPAHVNDMLAINPSGAFCEEENGAAWDLLNIHPRAGEHMLARHGLMTRDSSVS